MSTSQKGKTDLLLRLFDSQFFDEWLALSYIHQKPSGGVHEYLCNRLFELSDEAVQRILSPLIELVIHRDSSSSALDRTLIGLCSRSLRTALMVYWLLRTVAQDRPKTDHVHRLLEQCEAAGLALRVQPLYAPLPAIQRSLSGAADPPGSSPSARTSVGGAACSPFAPGTSSPAAGSPGEHAGRLSTPWDAGVPAEERPSAAAPPDAASAAAVQRSVSCAPFRTAFEQPPAAAQPDARPPGRFASERASSARDHTDRPSDPFGPAGSVGVGADARLVALHAELGAGEGVTGLLQRAMRDQEAGGPGVVRGAGELAVDRAQPDAFNCFAASAGFIDSLCSCSSSIATMPPPARREALARHLEAVNCKLDIPGGGMHNVLWPMGNSSRYVLRVVPERATVLNSAEKAPYLLFVECVESLTDGRAAGCSTEELRRVFEDTRIATAELLTQQAPDEAPPAATSPIAADSDRAAAPFPSPPTPQGPQSPVRLRIANAVIQSAGELAAASLDPASPGGRAYAHSEGSLSPLGGGRGGRSSPLAGGTRSAMLSPPASLARVPSAEALKQMACSLQLTQLPPPRHGGVRITVDGLGIVETSSGCDPESVEQVALDGESVAGGDEAARPDGWADDPQGCEERPGGGSDLRQTDAPASLRRDGEDPAAAISEERPADASLMTASSLACLSDSRRDGAAPRDDAPAAVETPAAWVPDAPPLPVLARYDDAPFDPHELRPAESPAAVDASALEVEELDAGGLAAGEMAPPAAAHTMKVVGAGASSAERGVLPCAADPPPLDALLRVRPPREAPAGVAEGREGTSTPSTLGSEGWVCIDEQRELDGASMFPASSHAGPAHPEAPRAPAGGAAARDRPALRVYHPPQQQAAFAAGAARRARMQRVYGASLADVTEHIRAESPYGSLDGWSLQAVIVKSGDDCRQELLAMQLIRTFKSIFEQEGLPLWLRPFQVLPASNRSALIELLPDCASVHSIKQCSPPGTSLADHFFWLFPRGTQACEDAQLAFAESLSAYSIVCYLLQIKDRHNANIMMDTQGRIIHIDFGFMLSNSPGGVNFERAPFKLTAEYMHIMDSSVDGRPSRCFNYFKVLCIHGFRVAQKHSARIIQLVEMMQHSGCPCFKSRARAIDSLKRRFPSQEKCVETVLNLISESVDAWTTRQYDHYQRVMNGIL